MSTIPQFIDVFPFQDDTLSLPVKDLEVASKWYCNQLSMTEIERSDTPVPHIVLKRDHVKLGFAINGGDASQDGAAVLVTHLQQLKDYFDAQDIETSSLRIDERDGQKYQGFFVVAPDDLCYYFHEIYAVDIQSM